MNIEEFFINIINQHRSVDTAESDFKKMIYEDPELRMAYREWCDEAGHTERKGFIEFCNAWLDAEESRWEVLDSEYE